MTAETRISLSTGERLR